jgi:inhibitor of cysteine peptidase
MSMSRHLVSLVTLLTVVAASPDSMGVLVASPQAQTKPATETRPSPAAPLRLTVTDRGKSAKARVGQTVLVSLRGNPTTGFNWSLDSSSVTGPLQPVGEPSFSPDSRNMGSGGVLTFTLTATKPGKSVLRYVYRRSWEATVPPAETVTFTVEVK